MFISLFISLLLLTEKLQSGRKHYIGTNAIHVPKPNMEIVNPIKDGMSEYY